MTTEAAADRQRAAAAAIGDSAGDDYVLAPREHATRYSAAAPALADLLRNESVRIAAERYEELDAEALELQRIFLRDSARARTGVVATTVAAGVLLAVGSLNDLLGSLAVPLLVSASLVSVTAGGLAAMWIERVRRGHLLEAWMSRRALAEMERLRYFQSMTSPSPEVDPLLQLEYFRRHQLEVQRRYYRERARDHRRKADQVLQFSTLMTAVGTVGTGAAGVLAVTVAPGWAALAAVGVAGPAVAAVALTREATDQSRRNAERYDRTRTTLDRLAERLPQVREATAAGRNEVLVEYVAAVHEQLSLEHRQWQEELSAAGEAMERLEAQLADVRIPHATD